MWSDRLKSFVKTRDGLISVGALVAIVASLILGAFDIPEWGVNLPLWIVTAVGGVPMLWNIGKSLIERNPGADILAALAIIAAALTTEWLVAAIIVLMLATGEALEAAASARASAVLDALAKRAPSIAHRVPADGGAPVDVEASEIAIGDVLVVFPHELCPVDGEVLEGRGSMDESFLTGEPYVITKSVGSAVMSGAINGEDALTVVAQKTSADSRYAQIVGVLHDAEENRPQMRRLADRLGVWYAVLALAMGIGGWIAWQDPAIFLSVMVIATPCPLLIAVPVAIIGAISLSARNGIIIKDPAVLERIPTVRAMMFDKTGTLTYGRPTLTEVLTASGSEPTGVLKLAAALEGYSRHPLSKPIVDAAKAAGAIVVADGDAVGGGANALTALDVASVSERPGKGLSGEVDGRVVVVTSRSHALESLTESGADTSELPEPSGAMECVVLIDGRYAATLLFRDEPRMGAKSFIEHLGPRHGVVKTLLISGDRSSEVEYVGRKVGIDEIHAGCSPEEKVALVKRETEQYPTLFLGDGINDAPAMAVASVGVAFGQNSDITAEAAGAVVLDSSLERLDELLHIGARMRRIALQSALGGIAASMVGMVLAVLGMLPPIAGAVLQEVIDLAAILNAARVAMPRKPLADYSEPDSLPELKPTMVAAGE